jgi:hypothetical protein
VHAFAIFDLAACKSAEQDPVHRASTWSESRIALLCEVSMVGLKVKGLHEDEVSCAINMITYRTETRCKKAGQLTVVFSAASHPLLIPG